MAEDGVTRRLAAVLAADVAGYTRLMEQDTDGTVAAWRDARDTVIKPSVAEYSGKIVKLTGDGFLVEFPTIQDAVKCAIAMQRGLMSGSLDFRMGVNLGDIVDDGEDIHGEGVNIAARIEALADPGGITISGGVHDQIRNRIDAVYEDLGEQQVKNVSAPVRVYAIRLDGAAAATGNAVAAKRKIPKQARWAVGAAAVVVAVLGVALWQPWVGKVGQADPDKMAFPLPTKPSIAVLPFDNLTGDKAQDYLADGLSENIITTLATLPGLFVIARNSTFTYKGKAVKVTKVAEELGVRFVLEGSVQRAGDTVRVTAQLIDAVRGFHVWTKSYDRELTNLFALQDEISEQIATALEVKLTEGEQARLRRKSTSNPEAYRLYLQGKANFRLFTPHDLKRAEKLFEQAFTVDPRFVAALVELAHVHYVYGRVRWSDDPTASFRKAEALVRQGLEIDADYPEAFTSLGRIERSWHRDFEKALTHHRKAVTLSPNCAECLRELANELQYMGDGSRAIPIFKQAMRLEPNYSILYLIGLGRSYNLTGEHPKAIQTFEEAIKRWPNNYWGYLNIAITYAMMGQIDDARRFVEETLRRRAGLRASLHAEFTPYKDRARAEREADLPRKAGMPD